MVDRPDPQAPGRSTVAVVITTYNHARFLADAIDSVLAQTCPAAEILVVDDGSTDDPASVVARFPSVRLVRQANQGLAAARNTGLREATTDKVIFLDADDRLLPGALASGLSCFAGAPVCAFVYGGHRRIYDNGRPRSENYYNAIGAEAYQDLLRGNLIGMHAAVMYDRARLIAIGGFDAALARCEDYDVYLRLSRSNPVVSHPAVVAEYRWHGGNVSGNHREMLEWSLRVHRRQAGHARTRRDTASAWRSGQTWWRNLYIGRMLTDARKEWRDRRALGAAIRGLGRAVRASPSVAVRQILASAGGRLRRGLSATLGQPIARSVISRPAPFGTVNLGDLDRTVPVGAGFGFKRGTPIDRYYVERFLARHAADIAGRVLEATDDSYCRRFGGSRITRQDVLSLSPDNRDATIVGDLSVPETLPPNEFDCLVLTQTLQYIFEMRAAVVQMRRALKPGGILLLTVPGISSLDPGAAGQLWCWSFTCRSARQLFADIFGAEHVAVESHGNVYAATAFLQGLVLEEVDRSKLDVEDVSYPIVVTVRAQKAGAANGSTAVSPSSIR